MYRSLLLIVLFAGLFSTNLMAQALRKPNEECIFSFRVKNGKTMMLAKDTQNRYIIYRFGKENHIDWEFPNPDSISWKKFTYNYYFRGGGKQNAGLDIDNLIFDNQGYHYVVYSSYSAGDEEYPESFTFGIVVTDPKNKKVNIAGLPHTDKGHLQGFRTNELLRIDNEAGLEE